MRVLDQEDIIRLLQLEVEKAGSQEAGEEERPRPDQRQQGLRSAMPPSKSIVRALGLWKVVALHDRSRILHLSDVRYMFRAEVALAGSQSELAKKNAIDRPFLTKVLRKERPPSANMVRALGLHIVVIDRADRSSPLGRGGIWQHARTARIVLLAFWPPKFPRTLSVKNRRRNVF
jgi:hypothetical protein